MLLGIETDDERGDVDDLLADTASHVSSAPNTRATSDIPDVPLLDKDTGVVDGLGKTGLEDLGLQAALQEILELEGKYVIETAECKAVRVSNGNAPDA